MKITKYILPVALAAFAACSDDSTSAKGDSSSSNAQSSSATGNSSAAVSKPETLFTTRVPDSTELNCGESGKIKFSQADWICSFNYGGKSGYFYVQSTPGTCEEIMSATPVFTTDKAQLYLGDSLITLSSALYDWGGNHKNDYVTFTYDGKLFKYYHSSFGFGWRSCQEMDCLQVYKTDSTTVIEDGCTSARTLPVVCRQANADGSFGSFTDTFAKCTGDDS